MRNRLTQFRMLNQGVKKINFFLSNKCFKNTIFWNLFSIALCHDANIANELCYISHNASITQLYEHKTTCNHGSTQFNASRNEL